MHDNQLGSISFLCTNILYKYHTVYSYPLLGQLASSFLQSPFLLGRFVYNTFPSHQQLALHHLNGKKRNTRYEIHASKNLVDFIIQLSLDQTKLRVHDSYQLLYTSFLGCSQCFHNTITCIVFSLTRNKLGRECIRRQLHDFHPIDVPTLIYVCTTQLHRESSDLALLFEPTQNLIEKQEPLF